MAERRPRRRLVRARTVIAVGVLALLVGSAAVATDTLQAGYYFGRVVARADLFINPPPDRDTAATIASTPRPRGTAPPAQPTNAPQDSSGPTAAAASGQASGTPATTPAGAGRSSGAGASSGPPASSGTTPTATAGAAGTQPTPTAAPVRAPVKFTIAPDPDAVFVHELNKEWCAVAATQSVLAILGKADTSDAFQQKLAGRIGEWESRRDSRDGGWGPGAIALALAAYGVDGYEVRAYATRSDALLDAALAIADTRAPAILLTWRGAHTWVMTGYQADADITVFPDANLTSVQILDPWYPFVSSLWGASHSPGFYQSVREMAADYLPWQRPEGRYADRDGKFIAVVPTKPG